MAGEELNQSHIAIQLGVSRIPVREAFRQLASEGLIETTPHKQAIVTRINNELIDELFEIRIALECMALRHAIKNLSKTDFDNLYEMINKMDKTETHEQWVKLNRSFHDYLYKKSKKEQLRSLINRMRDNSERYLWKNETSLLREQNANLEHKQIIQLCEDKKIEDAIEALAQHLQSTCDGLKEVILNKQKVKE